MIEKEEKMLFSRSVLYEALTALLVVTFGTSTWVSLGGLWVELPLLVNLGIPEGYRIGSFFIMVTQAAIIGPLLFITCQYFAPKNYHLEIPAIYVTLAVGATASFILIFFWDFYSVWSLDGSKHSTAFLTLVFFMALVDSTSNLTFMPFISSLKSKYLNWYFIGEGLSSVIPSFVVLIQGSGGDDECVANYTFVNIAQAPNSNITLFQNCTEWMVQKTEDVLFSPKLYYTFIFLLFTLSATSFCLLRCLPILREQYQLQADLNVETSVESNCCTDPCFSCFCCGKCRRNNPENIALLTYRNSEGNSVQGQLSKPQPAVSSVCDTINPGDLGTGNGEHETDLSINDNEQELLDDSSTRGCLPRNGHLLGSGNSVEEDVANDSSSQTCENKFSRKHIFLFATLTVISSLIYGVLPSIQSYSAGGYGSHTYLLATAFAEISVPIAFFLVMVRPVTSYLVVLLTSVTGMIAGAYCLVIATLSPTPPLQGHIMGKVLILSAWILQGFFFSYCRATIGWILRNDDGSRLSMMFFGGCTTIGTMMGALVMFPLVNLLNIFEGFQPTQGCANQVTCVMTEEEFFSLS